MTDDELIQLVAQMRRAQKDYFKTRDRAALQHSKSLEGQVDKAIAARQATQGRGLFG